MKYIIVATVLAASVCGKSPEKIETKETEETEETELLDNVPTAADGVPEANEKLRRLKTGLQKTSDDRMKRMDAKIGEK